MVSDDREKITLSPEEKTASVLFYLVGSETDALLNQTEEMEKSGLQDVNRDNLYLETTILTLFVMIKQYTATEKDQTKFIEVLDQIHFLLFHQMKEYSNYAEEEIEVLHHHIFERYDQYGDLLEGNPDQSWQQVLLDGFVQYLQQSDTEHREQIENNKKSIKEVFQGYLNQFYQVVPLVLNKKK